MMRVGIAADHGGFALKAQLAESLHANDYTIVDFGASKLNPDDDYPDFERRTLAVLSVRVSCGGWSNDVGGRIAYF